MQEADKCKILLLGESAVGKTSLFRRFAGNPNDKVSPTIGAEYKQKIMSLGSREVKIHLWDTAGTERYRTISPIYYRNLDGVLLVFDITDATSFRGLEYWIQELSEKGEEAEVVLVGNKNDQEERRQVPRANALKKAQELKVPYYQTNFHDEASVNEIFHNLLQKIVQRRQKAGNENMSKKSEFHSLKATDIGRKKSNQEDNCC